MVRRKIRARLRRNVFTNILKIVFIEDCLKLFRFLVNSFSKMSKRGRLVCLINDNEISLLVHKW